MKIKSIKKIKPRMVYAVTTTTGTFIADGLAHHNCVGCNVWGNGQLLDFEEYLKEELGDKKVEALKHSRHQIIKLTSIWYEEQIAFYKKKLETVLAHHNR